MSHKAICHGMCHLQEKIAAARGYKRSISTGYNHFAKMRSNSKQTSALPSNLNNGMFEGNYYKLFYQEDIRFSKSSHNRNPKIIQQQFWFALKTGCVDSGIWKESWECSFTRLQPQVPGYLPSQFQLCDWLNWLIPLLPKMPAHQPETRSEGVNWIQKP